MPERQRHEQTAGGAPASRSGDPVTKRHDAHRLGWVIRVLTFTTHLQVPGARLTILIGLAFAVLCGWYAVGHLGINTDTTGMLSPELQWRRDLAYFEAAFPNNADPLLIVIESESSERVEIARDELLLALRNDQDHFAQALVPGGADFLEDHALLFVSDEKVEELSASLARMQPVLGRLSVDPGAGTLLETLVQVREQAEPWAAEALKPVYDELAKAFEASAVGLSYPISWRDMAAPTLDDSQRAKRVISARPVDAYGSAGRVGVAIDRIREIASGLDLESRLGVSLGITGPLALKHDELLSLKRDAFVLTSIAIVLVLAVLLAGFQSFRLVLACIITLMIGLAITGAFAAASVGKLNLISIAFAALYIGLGIDYPIHLGLRYRELRLLGEDHDDALPDAVFRISPSLVACALTTALGFLAFVPTSFRGISELGIISSTGIMIGLVVCIVIFPAALTFVGWRGRHGARAKVGLLARALSSASSHHPRVVIIGSIACSIIGVLLLPQVRFDSNRVNLGDPETEAARVYEEMLDDGGDLAWRASAIVTDEAEASSLESRLEALETVQSARSLIDFIPGDQQQRLDSIDEMSMMMALTAPPTFGEPDEPRILTSVDSLIESLDSEEWGGEDAGLRDSGERLLEALRRFRTVVREQPKAEQHRTLSDLESDLLIGIRSTVNHLNRLLSVQEITLEDLPQRLIERWRSAEGAYRVEVKPAHDLRNEADLRRYVDEVTSVAPNATGAPILSIRAGDAVVDAFQQALFLSIIAIAALLVIQLRSLLLATAVLIPLLMTLLLMASISVVIGLSFNYANVIALPLVLGIGVDSGIHMVHRARAGIAVNDCPLATSTARGVVVSALTTICGFTGLLISNHPGTASLGMMLLLGIGLSLVATLVVLPALLRLIIPAPNADATSSPDPGATDREDRERPDA